MKVSAVRGINKILMDHANKDNGRDTTPRKVQRLQRPRERVK